jgi:hypothetical protein
MCPTGKVTYSSAAVAYRMISKKGQRLRAYKCNKCGNYHITSHFESVRAKDYKRLKLEMEAA